MQRTKPLNQKKVIDIASVKVGDKVHYQPSHNNPQDWENGIVKEVPEDSITEVRVVYHCNGVWENYREYTGQRTNVKDLHLGWKH